MCCIKLEFLVILMKINFLQNWFQKILFIKFCKSINDGNKCCENKTRKQSFILKIIAKDFKLFSLKLFYENPSRIKVFLFG